MRRLRLSLAVCLLVAGCYAQRRDEPAPQPKPTPTAPPPAPIVGLVPFADISGHDAGQLVTEIVEQLLRRHIKLVLLPGQGFLNEDGLAKALVATHGGAIVQGRVSAYDFQKKAARRLGPPDYDAVEARAVVSLSMRVAAPSPESPAGALIWSRSLLGEDHALWAENFRQEIGANPLADAYATPGGLMSPKPAAQMLSKAAERAVEMALPDLLRQLAQDHSVVTAQ